MSEYVAYGFGGFIAILAILAFVPRISPPVIGRMPLALRLFLSALIAFVVVLAILLTLSVGKWLSNNSKFEERRAQQIGNAYQGR